MDLMGAGNAGGSTSAMNAPTKAREEEQNKAQRHECTVCDTTKEAAAFDKIDLKKRNEKGQTRSLTCLDCKAREEERS